MGPDGSTARVGSPADRQVVVIGLEPEQVQPAATTLASLGLRQVPRTPLRLVASVALAEIVRQAGAPRQDSPPQPAGGHSNPKSGQRSTGELIVVDPAILLDY